MSPSPPRVSVRSGGLRLPRGADPNETMTNLGNEAASGNLDQSLENQGMNAESSVIGLNMRVKPYPRPSDVKGVVVGKKAGAERCFALRSGCPSLPYRFL